MAGELRESGGLLEGGLTRLATRKAIERRGQEGESGQKLRRGVRTEINRLDIPSLVDQLIEEEFVIDEKRAAVAADLSEALQKHFGVKGLSVILLGSAVHGGIKTREVVGISNTFPDFDWGITLDKVNMTLPEFDALRVQMRDFGDKLLGRLSKRYHIKPPLHGCHMYNSVHRWMENFRSADDARLELIGKNAVLLNGRVMMSFAPSFPKEENEANRQFVLEALTKIASYDRKKWSGLTSNILGNWEVTHKLKNKYLLDVEGETRRIDENLAGQVKILSEIMMSKRMRELVLATGNIEK